MIVAIVGSRWGVDEAAVEEYIASLPADTVVMSGGAYGVDSAAASAAKRYRLGLVVHHPDYQRYGRGAPLERNTLIARDCERLVAFVRTAEGTNGTNDVVAKARKLGKPVEVRVVPYRRKRKEEHDEGEGTVSGATTK